jgi:hypothetical protein
LREEKIYVNHPTVHDGLMAHGPSDNYCVASEKKTL